MGHGNDAGPRLGPIGILHRRNDVVQSGSNADRHVIEIDVGVAPEVLGMTHQIYFKIFLGIDREVAHKMGYSPTRLFADQVMVARHHQISGVIFCERTPEKTVRQWGRLSIAMVLPDPERNIEQERESNDTEQASMLPDGVNSPPCHRWRTGWV